MKTLSNKHSAFTSQQIASLCDHTYLKTVESYRQVARIGQNPIQQRQLEFFQFLRNTIEGELKPYGICVRAEDIPHARLFLDQNANKLTKLVATVGFPDGSWHQKHYKFFEAQYALSEGADEIDMPLNWRALKQGDHGAVLEELQTVSTLVHQKNGIFKLILETSLLNEQQVLEACKLAKHAGVDFIKTSTGFGTHGVQTKDVELILDHWDGGIKISGGVSLSNIFLFLDTIQKPLKGPDHLLDPKRVRIGESELLSDLTSVGS